MSDISTTRVRSVASSSDCRLPSNHPPSRGKTSSPTTCTTNMMTTAVTRVVTLVAIALLLVVLIGGIVLLFGPGGLGSGSTSRNINTTKEEEFAGDICEQIRRAYREVSAAVREANEYVSHFNLRQESPSTDALDIIFQQSLRVRRASSELLLLHPGRYALNCSFAPLRTTSTTTTTTASRGITHRRLAQASSPPPPAPLLPALKSKGRVHYPLPQLCQYESAYFSRSPSDGVLIYIFAMIGTISKMSVEVDGEGGTGTYLASMALSIFHGFSAHVFHKVWSGFNINQKMYDGDSASNTSWFQIRRASFPQTSVVVVEKSLSAAIFNEVLTKESAIGGQVDLLSILSTRMDYWIWANVTQIDPRVVMLEYQEYWGPTLKVTRPFVKESGTRQVGAISDKYRRRLFTGTSLNGLVDLGASFGYRLVGCLCSSPVAFFVKDNESKDYLPEVSPQQCFQHNMGNRAWLLDMDAMWEEAQQYEWISIE